MNVKDFNVEDVIGKKFVGYVSLVNEETGEIILDKVRVNGIRITKSKTIDKFEERPEETIGWLHNTISIPNFHCFDEVTDMPAPKFKVGDKVKTKTGKSIWTISKIEYNMVNQKWLYCASRTKSSGIEDYYPGHEEDFKKVED